MFKLQVLCDTSLSSKKFMKTPQNTGTNVHGKRIRTRWSTDVKYLHENNCVRYEHACSQAAFSGNIEMLTFLCEIGHTWNKSSVTNNLEMLKFLHENGCPWNEDTFYHAKKGGNQEIIQYLIERISF